MGDITFEIYTSFHSDKHSEETCTDPRSNSMACIKFWSLGTFGSSDFILKEGLSLPWWPMKMMMMVMTLFLLKHKLKVHFHSLGISFPLSCLRHLISILELFILKMSSSKIHFQNDKDSNKEFMQKVK